MARRLSIGEISSGRYDALLAAMGVCVVTTQQRLGGHRKWFECPTCHGRCATVFLTLNDLTCRRCAGISYPSQRLSSEDRLRTRAFSIYQRLNVDYSRWPRIFGPKPRGMHWRTYRQLLQRAIELETQAVELSAPLLSRLRAAVNKTGSV